MDITPNNFKYDINSPPFFFEGAQNSYKINDERTYLHNKIRKNNIDYRHVMNSGITIGEMCFFLLRNKMI